MVCATRLIIALLLGLCIALGAPAALSAQQDDQAAPSVKPFRIYMILWRGETRVERGFRDYLRDRNLPVEIIVRSVERDRKKLPGFVAEAKRLQPDLVYTWGTSVTRGVVGEYDKVDPEQHVTELPVVFTMVSSPDGARIVPTRASSGRNITGATHIVPIAIQLKAIQAYRPLTRLAIIYNPNELNSVLNVRELRDLSGAMGFELLDKPVPLDAEGEPDPSTLPDLISELAAREPQFLYLGPDSFVGIHRETITGEAIKHRLPTFTATELEIRHGNAMIGLITRYYNLGRFTGYKVEQILVEGRTPKDIPVETLARFTYAVKMEVARKLELYPPMELLNYAEVIE
jgi:putative ABC transport system substrate-binding protein